MKGHPHHEHDHDPAALLRESGLKVTDQRKKILQFLLDNHGPFTVEEMAKRLKALQFDLATLYRNMTAFEEAQLVQKVHFGDGTVRWELAHTACAEDHSHSGHHHHLICTVCGKIVSLDLCLPESTLAEVRALGYAQLRHNLEFSGICPSCQKKHS